MDRLEEFTTPRLAARRMAEDDFETLTGLHADTRVMATLGGIRSTAQTRRFLDEKMAHWVAHGFGHWMFRDCLSGAFVGRGGLQHIVIGGRSEVEVGYTVAADHQGQGYATEMTEAMVALAFDRLGLRSVVAFTLPSNAASRRVMEKTGFVVERVVEHAGEEHVLARRAALAAPV